VPPPAVVGPSPPARIADLSVVADLLAFNQDKFVGFSTLGEGAIQRSTGVITRWEPPIPIYVDPSITGTSVAEAMTYWASVTGLTFALVGADAEPRVTVRAASVVELPGSDGTGLVYRTYPNNRAQLGVIKVALSHADCSPAKSVACSALYRHELGHVLGIFDHVPGTGLMSPQGPSLNASPRELALLQQLYRLPHGTHIEPDGTWSVRAQP
jgi:predicted Zn-dependent protease